MFKIIYGLPDDVLGIEASGKVTHTDYLEVLVPEAKEKLISHPKLKMLYVTAPDFAGYDTGGLWDDAAFGLIHWREFSKIAVVTNVQWLCTAVKIFAPFFPGLVKLFDASNVLAAKQWLDQAQAP